jgi:perosamine synthetase
MPCDLDPIAELAEKHGLILIEDAAEAIGAVYRTKRIGSRNHLTVFSFHAAKLLTTIEGGAISTGDDEQAESLRGIRSHYEDRERKYWHVGLGLNMRPTELQAAIGLAQVHKVPAFIENRNKVARLYRDRLAPFLAPQEVPDYVGMHPYMFYAAFCGNNSEREHLVSHLTMKGVDYRMPWPPVHMQTFHRQFFSGQYPDAEQAFSRVISPPMCNDLTAEEVDYVIATIRDFFEETPR